MLSQNLAVQPLNILIRLGHLRKAPVGQSRLHILRQAEAVLAARDKPALTGIVAGEVLLLRLARGRGEQSMPLVQLCELHHGGVARAADDESGPAHEERLLIIANIRVYCSGCIKLLMPLLPGAAQQDGLLPWEALNLAEDDLFQSGPLRLWTGDYGQIVQILIHIHLLGAGENAGVVGPADGGRNAGAA